MVTKEQTTVVYPIPLPVTDLQVIKRRQHDTQFCGARRGQPGSMSRVRRSACVVLPIRTGPQCARETGNLPGVQSIDNTYGSGVAATRSRLRRITKEGDDMQQELSTGGLIVVSKASPRWKDWRGRQAYKYRFAGRSGK